MRYFLMFLVGFVIAVNAVAVIGGLSTGTITKPHAAGLITTGTLTVAFLVHTIRSIKSK